MLTAQAQDGGLAQESPLSGHSKDGKRQLGMSCHSAASLVLHRERDCESTKVVVRKWAHRAGAGRWARPRRRARPGRRAWRPAPRPGRRRGPRSASTAAAPAAPAAPPAQRRNTPMALSKFARQTLPQHPKHPKTAVERRLTEGLIGSSASFPAAGCEGTPIRLGT